MNNSWPDICDLKAIDQFLERHKLAKLTQREIGNMNKLIY
jgi:hypothetical protein